MALLDLVNSSLALAALTGSILLVLICLQFPDLVLLRPRKAGPPRTTRRSSRETSTTYRVQGIPLEWTIDNLKASLSEIMASETSLAPAIVKSLAPTVHGGEQEATVSIAGPRAPRPPRIGEFGVDQDFLGLSTLFKPAAGDHKIE